MPDPRRDLAWGRGRDASDAARARAVDPAVDLSLRTIVGRDPIAVDPDEPVARSLLAAFEAEGGYRPVVRGEIGWMDGHPLRVGCALRDVRADGRGEHTGTEWVDIGSVEERARVLERTARAFCA